MCESNVPIPHADETSSFPSSNPPVLSFHKLLYNVFETDISLFASFSAFAHTNTSAFRFISWIHLKKRRCCFFPMRTLPQWATRPTTRRKKMCFYTFNIPENKTIIVFLPWSAFSRSLSRLCRGCKSLDFWCIMLLCLFEALCRCIQYARFFVVVIVVVADALAWARFGGLRKMELELNNAKCIDCLRYFLFNSFARVCVRISKSVSVDFCSSMWLNCDLHLIILFVSDFGFRTKKGGRISFQISSLSQTLFHALSEECAVDLMDKHRWRGTRALLV